MGDVCSGTHRDRCPVPRPRVHQPVRPATCTRRVLWRPPTATDTRVIIATSGSGHHHHHHQRRTTCTSVSTRMCASRARPSKSAGAGTKACTSVPVTTDGALVLSPCRAAAPTPPRRMAPPPLASLRGDGRASEPGRSALRLSAGCGTTRGRAAPGWSPTGVAAPLPELPPEPVDMKLPYVGEAPASAPPAPGCWWKTRYPAARPTLCAAGGACGRAGAGVVASKAEARGGAGGGAAEGAGPAAAAWCDGPAAGGV